MNKAYYWHRHHPYFDVFYPGKVLDIISEKETLRKYPHAFEIKRFFPKGFSPHGLSMLYHRKFDSTDFEEPITELVFELVRQLYFPNAVSRLSCLYASKTIEQAEKWKSVFQKHLGENKNQLPTSLWEITFESTAKAYDANFLNVPPDDSFSFMHEIESAYSYWSGIFTENPLPELLIPYPVIVSRLVKDSESV